MAKDADHGALQEAVSTLKEGHVRLETKIDGFRDEMFAKNIAHNEKREARDREVDANFAKVNLRQVIWGITGTVSPFLAGGVLYPQKAIDLISSLYNLFV